MKEIVSTNEAKSIGIRAKKLRKAHNMTQENLAEKLNVSVDCISNYETGKTPYPAELIGDLCLIFNISADYFYFKKNRKLNPEPNNDFDWIVDTLKGCDAEQLKLFSIIAGPTLELLSQHRLNMKHEI